MVSAVGLTLTKTDRGSSEKSIFNCILVPGFLRALMLGWCVRVCVCLRGVLRVRGIDESVADI